MKKVLSRNFQAGSQEPREPRLPGSAAQETLPSNKPLAAANGGRTAQPGPGLFPDTHLCVDLKLWKLLPGRMPMGTRMEGTLARDAEDHFAFIQKGIPTGWAPRRNPHVFEGRLITVTRRADGSLHPNFRETDTGAEGFSVEAYALGVAEELRRGLRGLVGRK